MKEIPANLFIIGNRSQASIRMSSKTTAARKPASKRTGKARAATTTAGKSAARGARAKAAAPRKSATAAKAKKATAGKATPAAAPEAAVKPVPAPQEAPAVTPVPVIRRKEMVERIVARSGLKANAVKSVLDPLLREMGEALSRGEVLSLQPLGKLMVNRRKQVAGGEVMICKLRRKTPEKNGPQPLAKPAE